MTNKMNREQWSDEVLASTRSINKAEPGCDFFEQVKIKLNKPAAVRDITLPVKQWVAAAILLLALNISSIVYFMDHSKRSGGINLNNPLASEMQLETTYNY